MFCGILPWLYENHRFKKIKLICASATCIHGLTMIANAIVAKALEYVDLKTHVYLCVRFDVQCLVSEEI